MPRFTIPRPPSRWRDLSSRSFGPATEKYRELGTVANLLVFNRFDALPTRNFQTGRFEGGAACPGRPGPRGKVARNSCAACTIGCEHVYAISVVLKQMYGWSMSRCSRSARCAASTTQKPSYRHHRSVITMGSTPFQPAVRLLF